VYKITGSQSQYGSNSLAKRTTHRDTHEMTQIIENTNQRVGKGGPPDISEVGSVAMKE
jgi:hypothetical protein